MSTASLFRVKISGFDQLDVISADLPTMCMVGDKITYAPLNVIVANTGNISRKLLEWCKNKDASTRRVYLSLLDTRSEPYETWTLMCAQLTTIKFGKLSKLSTDRVLTTLTLEFVDAILNEETL